MRAPHVRTVVRSVPRVAAALLLLGAAPACDKKASGASTQPSGAALEVKLLNVSYDPTRELFVDVNGAFAKSWKEKAGQTVVVSQSHGGSGKQARAVIDGLEADVVTLALAYDIDAISDKAKLLPADWQKRLPNNSSPYVSTIAFLVRKGNPKGIKNWDDLVKPGVSVITPNPKTSGAARWNYLAAWGFALKRELGDLGKTSDPARAGDVAAAEAKAETFISALFKNVPVLDSGARGATTTFVSRGIGDVLVNWENEILLGAKELGPEKFEVIVPPVSILAEPAVSIVDKNTAKHGTEAVAKAYLDFLYTPEGQEIAVKHHFRPRSAEVFAKHEAMFPKTDLFTIDQVSGDWRKAQKKHFDDGGVFDKVYKPK
jgi:sulfate/thiosulfate transport system substrate-binding protein